MILLNGPGLFCYRRIQLNPSVARRYISTKTYEPLRILFCGSDDFSIASLNALHKEHCSRPDLISSIDVVCRPGKRVGRGLKTIREVPIKSAASDLSLPVHEIDTFRGWTPPVLAGGPINLIIAVSFGLFVPPRILNGAKYGGLNVHPSLLPDLRGPAPLHHTLLAGHKKTGVTLQTLDSEHFDHGVILDQTPAPGFDIPNPDSCTVPQLLEVVSSKSTQMLVNGIRNGIFVPPLKDAGWRSSQGEKNLIHATKIKPEDRHIDWKNWTLAEIFRRNRVLGPLWSMAQTGKLGVWKRVIFTEMEEVMPLAYPGDDGESTLQPGMPFLDWMVESLPGEEPELCVRTSDSRFIRLRQLKVEGQQATDGIRAARKADLFTPDCDGWLFFNDTLQ